MWHITDKCMLDCGICFTKKMRRCRSEVLFKDIQPYILLLQRLGVQKIDISGGEPLLYAHLPTLVEQCALQSIAVTITTSGVGEPETAKWVAKHHNLFSRIIVSLDGSKNIHNKLRGSNRAYEGFEQFCSLLHQHKAPNVRINTVLTKESADERICDELCEVIGSIHPLEWCLIEPFPINKTVMFDSLTVSREEYEQSYKKCVSLMRESGIQIIRRVNNDYGSYWALYPDGYLYYSHNNDTYDTKILLREDQLPAISSAVKATRQTYIEIIKEHTNDGKPKNS